MQKSDFEFLENKEYTIKTELSKEEIEEKILHHFYFLKEEDNLKKFYGEYKVQEKQKFEKEENREEEEEGDIMLEIWGKIIKFLLEDILHCFYIKISDIIKYTTIKNTKPKAIKEIMKELRKHFVYISQEDLLSENFYIENFPDLYPPTTNFIYSFFSLIPISMGNPCREEKTDKNESEKKSYRKDLTENDDFPENSIFFNYEIFQNHCECFLMVIKDILEDNDANVMQKKALINNINENYVENERNKYGGKFKLRYGTKYLDETMNYLKKMKKIIIFPIESNKNQINFVKVLKDKDDLVNEDDRNEAKNILNNNENIH